MSDWSEIKRPFRDALIAAFNWSRLAVVLNYHCDRRLDRITAENEGFDKNVDDVIADAVQTGWLEKLAKGALAENETHTGLKATVPHILKGVATEGKAYYQATTKDPTSDLENLARHQSEPMRQQKKVLDAAIRSEVRVGEETLLLVLVRDQYSSGLYAILKLEPEYEIQDEDVRQSRPFRLYFPVDESGNLLPAPVEIVITSPGFDPPTQSKNFEVPPAVENEDELYPGEFILTPLRTGTLWVIIEVYQRPENKRTKIGSKPISTVSLKSTSKYAEWRVQTFFNQEAQTISGKQSTSVLSDHTIDPNQDRIHSSDDQVGNGHDKADSRWTFMLQAALDQWRSNLSAIKSLSRTAGQAAAVGAAVTVIGTLLYLALTVNQEESDRLLLVFGSLLFAGAAFVFGQIWGRVLIFAYFILEQLPDPIQAVALAAVGGITGYFVFYMMVQTFVYSWVPGTIAGLAMAGLAHMNLRSMWKAYWTVPILAAALTMIICYVALVYSNEAELGNAFGVLASGIFVTIFVRKSMDMPFLVPGKSDKARS